MEEPVGAIADALAEELSGRIADGRIPLGSWLRQDAVADEFRVSRTPVREAFRALQGKGIVEMHPRRGALVRGPSLRDIREGYLVRAELEGYAAELAVEHARDEHLLVLRECIDQFQSLTQRYLADEIDDGSAGEAWRAANERFHRTLLEAAGNDQLRRSIDDLSRRLPRNVTFRALGRDSYQLNLNLKEHTAICAALELRDGAAIRTLTRDHHRRAAHLVSHWYERNVMHPGPLR